jgi:uncharacterized protein YPO0396
VNTVTNMELFPKEQFRLRQISLYNWGTFDKLHHIKVAKKGHLVVGRSGAGKTTILDAISTMLIPARVLHYNAAASQNTKRRDRSFVSYVRGTWGEQTDKATGSSALQHRRSNTTMSAIALMFQNDLGRVVTLVRIFWIKGTSSDSGGFSKSGSGFGMHFMIVNRAFDLMELGRFQDADFDVRQLRKWYSEPEVHFDSEFGPYCDRFRRILGIDSEAALLLLHRTQSAKNMDNLNDFLRDFMLDRPSTFEVADHLVKEFTSLNEAHAAVVKARDQIKLLEPAQEQYFLCTNAKNRQSELRVLMEIIPAYREQRRIEFWAQEVKANKSKRDQLKSEIASAATEQENARRALNDLRNERAQLGGAQIENLEQEKRSLEAAKLAKLAKRKIVAAAFESLEWGMTESPEYFALLQEGARSEIDKYLPAIEERRQRRFDLQQKIFPMHEKLAALSREVASLKNRPSNLPSWYVDVRSKIAEAVGLDVSDLPFVGELIQALPDEERWHGAIERLLRPTALTLLVKEGHFSRVAKYINETHLGGRLQFSRVTPRAVSSRPLHAQSVVHKLEVKEGQWASWVTAELQQFYGDYRCVDSVAELEAVERGLTEKGLIKQGRDRHVKDDRFEVSKRSEWVTGFDSAAKIAALEAEGAKLAEQNERLSQQVKDMDAEDTRANKRILPCQTVVDTTFEEINLGPVLQRISQIDGTIAILKGENPAMLAVEERIKIAEDKHRETENRVNGLHLEYETVDKAIGSMERRFAEAQGSQLGQRQLAPFVKEKLDERFAVKFEAQRGKNLTPERIGDITSDMLQDMTKEAGEVSESIRGYEIAIQTAFTKFVARWPEDSGDVDGTLGSADDFFVMLGRLKNDRLPQFEGRFYNLLRGQSHQNLASLVESLTEARNDIRERLDSVNEILEKEPFNNDNGHSTFMHIEVRDRHIQELVEFRQKVREALSNAFTDDQEQATARFEVVSSVVKRLGSAEPADVRWRDVVLDVRQHVEFIGRETNADGEEVQLWTGGESKSGGQRQKLAATCLAAALRYQLGGHDLHYPLYAPVVLDEAFDKSDHEFTITIMNIFIKFGFQLIVATPIKSVMALEPFVGGASFIEIRDRKDSAIKAIEYDDEASQLVLSEEMRRKAAAAALGADLDDENGGELEVA